MENNPESPAPGVYLVGTPIGNLEDVTLRAIRILSRADVLACEDTRVTRKLFQRHGIRAPKTLIASNAHNERKVAERLVAMAAKGGVVAYCSDAGTPGISDPGLSLSRAAVRAGVLVSIIPGPSAVVAAVALAGVPAAAFTFLGFPSRRDGRLADILKTHGSLAPALVFYESPNRLTRLLDLAAEHIAPDREGAVCLELTKKFERVRRGGMAELAELFRPAPPRGEATVVIAGAGKARDEEDESEFSGGNIVAPPL